VRRVPIRVRLALVFGLAMAVVLAGAGLFVYERVASDLADSLDQQLRGRAQDLSALVGRGGSLAATDGALVERGESFAELLAADGRVVDATPPLGRRVLLTPAELARARAGAVFTNRPAVPGLDEPARLLALPLARSGRSSVLVVGATRENRAETLSSLRDAFLIGGPIALLLAILGGYWLAGAALRPIEAMRRRAGEITSSSIDERLPVPAARDEVARLGETLNEMLARIEAGVARERRFVADASHELRTPLALLKAELELGAARARSPEELERTVRSVAATTDRLARLADDLLLLARAEQGSVPLRVALVDVLDVLDDVARSFAVRAETEGRAVVVAAAEPLVVQADPLRLAQAVGNLVDNAFRHGAGAVTLDARQRERTVELRVSDEGAGFPEPFIGHALERFSRADGRSPDGAGLGLAIVETIARAHGGEVRVANRAAGGAEVAILLPAGDRAPLAQGRVVVR
jgi:two-component system, OmpR family, sensor kinase